MDTFKRLRSFSLYQRKRRKKNRKLDYMDIPSMKRHSACEFYACE